jgi:hypothetical protein
MDRRNGNAATCEVCKKALAPKRGSRRQSYCCYRCRNEARRRRNFERFARTKAPVVRPMGRGSPGARSIQNPPEISTICKLDFGGRGSQEKAPVQPSPYMSQIEAVGPGQMPPLPRFLLRKTAESDDAA